MTLAWSCSHGNSAAVWRAFTVAIPHLVWLMAGGARGRGVGRLQGADSHRSVFRALVPSSVYPLTGGPAVLGSYRQASWAQCAAHCG